MDMGARRLCAWSGLALLLCFGAGLLIAGFVPPPSPGLDAAQVAHRYVHDQERIRGGALLLLVGTVFWIPWQVAITDQLRRAEGGLGPFSLVNLAAGTLGLVVVLAPSLLWLIAAYRPAERAPGTMLLLNDIAWLTFVGTASLVVIQNLAIALAILRAPAHRASYPRWAGYLNLWTVPLLVPGFAVYLFHSGPLAWNGVFAWWLPLVVFGGWFLVMIFLTLSSLRRQADAESATSSHAALV